jgi:hypothetical protein
MDVKIRGGKERPRPVELREGGCVAEAIRRCAGQNSAGDFGDSKVGSADVEAEHNKGELTDCHGIVDCATRWSSLQRSNSRGIQVCN